MGTAEFKCWITLLWTSIPSRGVRKYSKSLHATDSWISSGLMGHLLVNFLRHSFRFDAGIRLMNPTELLKLNTTNPGTMKMKLEEMTTSGSCSPHDLD